MACNIEISLEQQQRLVTALLAYFATTETVKPEHMETHISHLILAGDRAFKLKKPLNLGFLDFSTLARRCFCCEEEIRLNSRLAPELYLDVVPVTGTPDAPELAGKGPVIDYAVRMRRFDQSELLSNRLPDQEAITEIAKRVARFHQQIPRVEPAAPYGSPEQVIQPMLENFEQIRAVGLACLQPERLAPLEAHTRSDIERLRPLIRQRQAEGFVRECHGDMHLGNITRYRGRLEIFDGIEFNPDLRWIDTVSEVAFLLMDLQHRGLASEAVRFLNDYLELTGDYLALPLLRFYQRYRAMVRAKVAAIRLSQGGLDDNGRDVAQQEYLSYLALAEAYCRPGRAALLITHGLSGSGKSLFSGWLAQRLPAVRLRSDVERQRIFRLPDDAPESAGLLAGIYTPAATRATYEHLLRLASALLQAGYLVIVDATFLKSAQRKPFEALARETGCAYLILDCQAPEPVLRQRVQRRMRQGADASEADLQVLEMQLGSRQALDGDELDHRIEIATEHYPPQGLLERVESMLSGER